MFMSIMTVCRRSCSAMRSGREGGQTGQLHKKSHAHPAGQVAEETLRATAASLAADFCVFSSLPEVPALVDVPCVSAQLDDSVLSLLRDRVSRHGAVSSHPPVQIEELQERPGGILVRWCKVGMATLWKNKKPFRVTLIFSFIC